MLKISPGEVCGYRALHSVQAKNPIKAACQYVRCCFTWCHKSLFKDWSCWVSRDQLPPLEAASILLARSRWQRRFFFIALPNHHVYFPQTFWKGNSLFLGSSVSSPQLICHPLLTSSGGCIGLLAVIIGSQLLSGQSQPFETVITAASLVLVNFATADPAFSKFPVPQRNVFSCLRNNDFGVWK